LLRPIPQPRDSLCLTTRRRVPQSRVEQARPLHSEIKTIPDQKRRPADNDGPSTHTHTRKQNGKLGGTPQLIGAKRRRFSGGKIIFPSSRSPRTRSASAFGHAARNPNKFFASPRVDVSNPARNQGRKALPAVGAAACCAQCAAKSNDPPRFYANPFKFRRRETTQGKPASCRRRCHSPPLFVRADAPLPLICHERIRYYCRPFCPARSRGRG
jgi:hypothetical protein